MHLKPTRLCDGEICQLSGAQPEMPPHRLRACPSCFCGLTRVRPRCIHKHHHRSLVNRPGMPVGKVPWEIGSSEKHITADHRPSEARAGILYMICSLGQGRIGRKSPAPLGRPLMPPGSSIRVSQRMHMQRIRTRYPPRPNTYMYSSAHTMRTFLRCDPKANQFS